MIFPSLGSSVSYAVSSIKKPSFLDKLFTGVGTGLSAYQSSLDKTVYKPSQPLISSPVVSGQGGSSNYIIIGALALVAMVILLK